MYYNTRICYTYVLVILLPSELNVSHLREHATCEIFTLYLGELVAVTL